MLVPHAYSTVRWSAMRGLGFWSDSNSLPPRVRDLKAPLNYIAQSMLEFASCLNSTVVSVSLTSNTVVCEQRKGLIYNDSLKYRGQYPTLRATHVVPRRSCHIRLLQCSNYTCVRRIGKSSVEV